MRYIDLAYQYALTLYCRTKIESINEILGPQLTDAPFEPMNGPIELVGENLT
tara:strand:+ start:100 stop:255 length:156 start_codon:yes stop_codon:yes gene_type:complete